MSLRFGALAALRRCDVDTALGAVHVHQSQAELSDGRWITKGTKSRAGWRRAAVPTVLLPEFREHLLWYAQLGREGRVFAVPKGGHLRRQNFRRLWRRVLTDSGVPVVHFHDLRHTGSVLAAEGGATLRELMERMRHASPWATMIYQHAAKERDRKIAKGLSLRITQAREYRKTTGEQQEEPS